MLTWKRALKECENTTEETPIRVSDLVTSRRCSKQIASKKLRLLRLWGYIHYANVDKRGYGGYAISIAGQKLLDQWKREQVDLDTGSGLYTKCRQCSKEEWLRRSSEGDEL